MSESSLQMLLHAGEVEYIVKTIRAAKLKNVKFVGGCLFGLWRNSLKQPTIQFVTGPGKAFNESTSIKKMFDSEYTSDCVNYIRDSHRLLHLGFWFCGTDQDKQKVETLVFSGQKQYNVLLFVNVSNAETPFGEYIIRKDNSRVKSPLYKEDVLSGHCSFRLYKPLVREIKKNAIELGDTNESLSREILGLLDSLPSRIQVEEAEINEGQWYSTDVGMVLLQRMSQYLNEAGVFAGMSRDAATHNIQFDMRGGYSLDFPANFPKRLPLFCCPDGQRFEIPSKYGEADVCKYVVDVALNQIQNLQGQGGRGRNKRR